MMERDLIKFEYDFNRVFLGAGCEKDDSTDITMTKVNDPNSWATEWEESFRAVREILFSISGATGYTRWQEGDCFKLYLILKIIYPDAEVWYCVDHVYTKIGGYFYDIEGGYPELGKTAFPMSQEPGLLKEAEGWSYEG